MSLPEWTSNLCSNCGCSTITQFCFSRDDRRWMWFNIYYLQCPRCNQLFIGEYSKGKVSGHCWSMMPINKVHQIEGFISQAYWRFNTEELIE